MKNPILTLEDVEPYSYLGVDAYTEKGWKISMPLNTTREDALLQWFI